MKLGLRSWLLLPIEVVTRELDAKLLLACEAVTHGFGVVVGPSGFNQDGEFPRGIYFDKCLSPHKEEFLRYQVETIGNRLVSQDEEGLLYISDEGYLRTRTSKATMRLSTIIFTWGDKQHQLLEKCYQVPEKLICSGSPRIDSWREAGAIYPEKIREIKAKYGKFLLVSSNFGSCRDEGSIDRFIEDKKKMGLALANSPEELRERAKYWIAVKDSFLDLIRTLSHGVLRDLELNLVVRPHPSDDVTVWQDLEREKLSNIVVSYGGEISPYIVSSQGLIHNNCTSAIEAAVNQVPTMAYLNHSDQRFEYDLPNCLGVKTSNHLEVVDFIKEIVSEVVPKIPLQGIQQLQRFLSIDEQKSTRERMIDALKALEVSPQTFVWKRYSCLNVRSDFSRQLKRVKSLITQDRQTRRYQQQKNPGIKLSDVERIVNYHEKLTGHRVSFKKLRSDVFCMYGNTPG